MGSLPGVYSQMSLSIKLFLALPVQLGPSFFSYVVAKWLMFAFSNSKCSSLMGKEVMIIFLNGGFWFKTLKKVDFGPKSIWDIIFKMA